MRATVKDLMDKLGVGYILSAYETCPWSAFDDEAGLSCNGEVRMNSSGDEMEAELQIMRDNPKGDEKHLEQVCWILMKPAVEQKWDVKNSRVLNEDKADKTFNWEEKSVNFFHACIQELKAGKIPDIDEIYEREINKKDRFGDNSQGGGSKAPKIKPQALLGMKGGGGM